MAVKVSGWRYEYRRIRTDRSRDRNRYARFCRELKKPDYSDEGKETGNDYWSLVSQMSGQSVYEIDHLIEGLQGVREKLDKDGDSLHREIVQYAAFSQSII